MIRAPLEVHLRRTFGEIAAERSLSAFWMLQEEARKRDLVTVSAPQEKKYATSMFSLAAGFQLCYNIAWWCQCCSAASVWCRMIKRVLRRELGEEEEGTTRKIYEPSQTNCVCVWLCEDLCGVCKGHKICRGCRSICLRSGRTESLQKYDLQSPVMWWPSYLLADGLIKEFMIEPPCAFRSRRAKNQDWESAQLP